MSGSLSVPKEIADSAASDLDNVIVVDDLKKEPWDFPPPGRQSTQRVTDAWFKVRVSITEGQ